jgi:hypothetical protein
VWLNIVESMFDSLVAAPTAPVVLARLDEHPNPLVVVPGRGAYEPRDGATVSDVVRAAVR